MYGREQPPGKTLLFIVLPFVTLVGLAALADSFISPSSSTSVVVSGVASPAGPVPAGPSLASPTADGTVGATFTAASTSGTDYDIRLDKVTQQATLTPYEAPVNVADHIAAAEFTVTGKVSKSSDDAGLAALAGGSNGAAYPPSYSDITEGASFAGGGQFAVSPGQAVTGWVTFELPPGVTVTRIQWRPAFGTGAITWTMKGERQ